MRPRQPKRLDIPAPDDVHIDKIDVDSFLYNDACSFDSYKEIVKKKKKQIFYR